MDFGLKWFNISCSQNYWSDINPIFTELAQYKTNRIKWSEIQDKDIRIYRPLLLAFCNEIKRSYQLDQSLPKKMVEYLLGEFDFYKVISIDSKTITQIQTFNLHGQLNKYGSKNKPRIQVPLVSLPTRIVSIEFKPNSNNTIELYLDNGWQFSFRIHNASTIVEPSLKFDIQIIGMPATIISINCKWN